MNMHIDGLDHLIVSMTEAAAIPLEEKMNMIRRGALVVQRAVVEYLNAHHHRTGELADSIVLNELPSFESIIVEPGAKENRVTARTKHEGTRTWKRKTYKIHGRSGHNKSRADSHHGPGNTVMDIGFYLEYGTTRTPAAHWLENSLKLAEDEFHAEMSQAWDEYLQSKGL